MGAIRIFSCHIFFCSTCSFFFHVINKKICHPCSLITSCSLNRASRRKRGMASNPLFIIPDFFSPDQFFLDSEHKSFLNQTLLDLRKIKKWSIFNQDLLVPLFKNLYLVKFELSFENDFIIFVPIQPTSQNVLLFATVFFKPRML